MELALVVLLAVKAGVVAASVYPLARRDRSRFRGKAMGVRAVLYPAMMLLIPVTWLLAGQPSPYPFLADIALGIPFLVDALANDLGLFDIKGFDAIPHSTGWFFLALAFGLAVAPMAGQRWIAFGLVAGFGAFLDVTWEIGEFLLMKSGASGLDLTYQNTIQDLALSLLGALVGALVIATLLWPPVGTPATLFGWQ
jgi:hypothetical protein